MNNNVNFANNPRVLRLRITGSGSSNANADGTGTVGTNIFDLGSGASNGSMILKIKANALGNTSDNVVRFFKGDNDTGSPTAKLLDQEVIVPSKTRTSSDPRFMQTIFPESNVLNSGQHLYVAILTGGTSPTDTFDIEVTLGDF